MHEVPLIMNMQHDADTKYERIHVLLWITHEMPYAP